MQALKDDCWHLPDRIEGSWGEALQTERGWWLARKTANGLEAVAVENCPGCGIKLWGIP